MIWCNAKKSNIQAMVLVAAVEATAVASITLPAATSAAAAAAAAIVVVTAGIACGKKVLVGKA